MSLGWASVATEAARAVASALSDRAEVARRG